MPAIADDEPPRRCSGGVSSGGGSTTVGVCGVTSPGMPLTGLRVRATRSSMRPFSQRIAKSDRQDPWRPSSAAWSSWAERISSGVTTGLSRRIRRKSESWISATTISPIPPPGAELILSGSGGPVHGDSGADAGGGLARGDQESARGGGPGARQRADQARRCRSGQQQLPAAVQKEQTLKRQQDSDREPHVAPRGARDVAPRHPGQRAAAQQEREQEEQQLEAERRGGARCARPAPGEEDRADRGQRERDGHQEGQQEGAEDGVGRGPAPGAQQDRRPGKRREGQPGVNPELGDAGDGQPQNLPGAQRAQPAAVQRHLGNERGDQEQECSDPDQPWGYVDHHQSVARRGGEGGLRRHDVRDLDERQLGAVAARAVVAFALAELEDADLFAAEVLHDLGDDFRALDRGSADRCLLAVVNENDLGELQLLALLGPLLVELEGRAFFRAVLPAAVLEDCVHGPILIANAWGGIKTYFHLLHEVEDLLAVGVVARE